MSKIAYLVAGVAAAESCRARMAKTGTNPSGDPLWTQEELAILRRCYPDYQAAIRSLGGRRSYHSVRAKAQALGLAPKRNRWTSDQVSRLRRVYRCGTVTDIQRAFPEKTMADIQGMAKYFGIRRPRKPFAPTGFVIIDQIRERCFECALSMIDLDEMAGTGSYFSRAGWHVGSANPGKVAKAVKALGGQLAAKWDDAPEDVPEVSRIPNLMPGGRLSGTAHVVRLAA